MCVCVCGVIEEKGRENGREKRTPKNTIGSEAGRLLSTSLHAAAQRSKVHVFLDGLGYIPTSASVSIKAHLVSRIHTQEQDTGCPSLENWGWWVKDL